MEQSKTRTYLKYAIGEITLVMVGILLALQVSNWNEERVEKQKAINYHLRLYEEINVALINIDERVEEAKKMNEDMMVAMKVLKSKKPESSISKLNKD